MAYHIRMIESLTRLQSQGSADAIANRIAWHRRQLAKHGVFAI